VSEDVDFVLAFYVVHEIPNQEEFLNEKKSILKPNGQVFIVEPPFHVSKDAFEKTVRKAQDAGFTPVERPKVLFSKTVILKRANQAQHRTVNRRQARRSRDKQDGRPGADVTVEVGPRGGDMARIQVRYCAF
jgi:tRNA A58 N-methylase Trm61